MSMPIRRRIATSTRRRPLPVAPTVLIGRAAERADLARRLRDPACRLITLVGPGGIGKSRLALQIADELAPAFADGAAFVALAPVAAAETVPAAIAEALDIPLAGGDSPFDQLLAMLRERELLLVIDNLEHLLDATPLFAAIPPAGARRAAAGDIARAAAPEERVGDRAGRALAAAHKQPVPTSICQTRRGCSLIAPAKSAATSR